MGTLPTSHQSLKFFYYRSRFGPKHAQNRNSTVHISNFAAKIRLEVEICRTGAITPLKVIQGHRFWYQQKNNIRLPISD